jgi:hypothetical protein
MRFGALGATQQSPAHISEAILHAAEFAASMPRRSK